MKNVASKKGEANASLGNCTRCASMWHKAEGGLRNEAAGAAVRGVSKREWNETGSGSHKRGRKGG